MTVRDMAACARQAAWEMAVLPDALRRRALLQMAGALEAEATRIFEANARDMARAAEEGLAAPLAKRLRFDGAKLADACAGLRALAALHATGLTDDELCAMGLKLGADVPYCWKRARTSARCWRWTIG